jgi:hypothetical protein
MAIKLVGWVERSDTHQLLLMADGFRKGLNPSYALNTGQRQPWPECGVTGRITPTDDGWLRQAKAAESLIARGIGGANGSRARGPDDKLHDINQFLSLPLGFRQSLNPPCAPSRLSPRGAAASSSGG